MKNRTFTLALILCLSLSLAVPVGAANSVQSGADTFPKAEAISCNEYEQVKALQSISDHELSALGMTNTEIQELRNFSYENALLERAQLSTKELIGLGYTLEQIEILRNYNGEEFSPDSPMAQATPKVDGSISFQKLNNNKVRIRYTWTWNVAPIECFTDVVGIRAQLNNSGSKKLSSEIKSYTHAAAYYSTTKNGTKTAKTLSVQIYPNLDNPAIYARLGARTGDTINPKYPYTGYIEMDVGPVSSTTIASAQAIGGYGHSVLSISPSISIGSGVSISFTPEKRVTPYITAPASRVF